MANKYIPNHEQLLNTTVVSSMDAQHTCCIEHGCSTHLLYRAGLFDTTVVSSMVAQHISCIEQIYEKCRAVSSNTKCKCQRSVEQCRAIMLDTTVVSSMYARHN